jgi:hypothetical protein
MLPWCPHWDVNTSVPMCRRTWGDQYLWASRMQGAAVASPWGVVIHHPTALARAFNEAASTTEATRVMMPRRWMEAAAEAMLQCRPRVSESLTVSTNAHISRAIAIISWARARARQQARATRWSAAMAWGPSMFPESEPDPWPNGRPGTGITHTQRKGCGDVKLGNTHNRRERWY